MPASDVKKYECEFEDCDWKVEADTVADCLGFYKLHVTARHQASNIAASKAEKAKRPELAPDISEEDWTYFQARWTQYKKATGLKGDDVITQLLECCTEPLRRDHHRTFSGARAAPATEAIVVAELKQIAVCKRNKAVNRVKLSTLKQDKGEPIRKFAGRVRSLAAVNGYSVKCTGAECGQDVSYTEPVIMDQLIAGLADGEIQKDVLSHTEADTWDLEKLLKYVEGKESGLSSQVLMSGSGGGAVGVVKPAQRRAQGQGQKACFSCGEKHPRGPGNCKAAGVSCDYCGKIGHLSKVCFSKKGKTLQDGPKDAAVSDNVDNCSLFIRNKDMLYSGVIIEKEAKDEIKDGLKKLPAQDCISKEAIIVEGQGCLNSNSDIPSPRSKKLLAQDCKIKDGAKKLLKERKDPLPALYDYNKALDTILTVMVGSAIASTTMTSKTLHHQVFDRESQRWQQRPARRKPFIKVKMRVDKESCKLHGARNMNVKTQVTEDRGMADTGASVCLTGPKPMRAMGLTEENLMKCDLRLYGADNSDIELVGAVFVIITDTQTGRETKQLLYICNKAASLLLSLEACADLGLVNPEFPATESAHYPSIAAARAGKKPDCDCKCPVRVTAPDVPLELPLEPTPENVPRLEQWIREYYDASAFNCCECQPLPDMHGPPVKIHIQDGVKPVASHTPIPIPLHWHKQVKAGLDRDEAIGVIEKVPPGTPTTWCHKMVCVPKKDLSPRRTVNFVPLNQHSSRQTHHTMSPFHQASMVPSNTYKTVLDAWNGYHSCSLDEESKHLTTFITPFGRYRYRKLPQGFLASGDAYTDRYDKIIADVEDKTKIVDDTILWKPSIKESFFQTCRYLTLCSRNGIVFNRKKFCFAKEEVEFAGFLITNSEVKPSQKILASISDFPVPKTISDIRGWFGLVNQVAPFFANRRVMEPFRELLKPPAQGKKVYWDDNLTKLFKESKEVIVEAIKEGIKCFKVGEWTCLMPDFCKTGLGFLLMQKRCKCEDVNPYCCQGGWQVVLAGSRFTKDAEMRYAPVEGEALAVAWSLAATRHYTLGNTKLIVATDHKPLLKVLGDRKLEDIDNPRLLRLKEKTLNWKFKVIHVPGRIHVGPDTLSRKEAVECMIYMLSENSDMVAALSDTEGRGCPSSNSDIPDLPNLDADIEAQVAANIPTPLTWQQVRDEVSRDRISTMLSDQISEGFPPDKKLLRLELREYFQHRDHLTQIDGVPLFKNRVVIPSALRPMVLETLHSAHQGVTGMTLRAQTSVWWPGITPQIRETRDKCRVCNECAPSQPSAPPEPLQLPDYPFQQVAADYFQAGGYHYLVMVDRFSGWPTVFFCGGSTNSSRQLQVWSRQYFATYGIPEELASDGGLTFTSYETQKFLRDYGVKHRLSSVAFAQSNKRAELGVKSMKRLIRENTNSDGSLTNDKFLQALMTYRNTPDRDTHLSPAQVIFGRNLRDFLPSPQTRYKPQPEWIMLREDREKALAKRAVTNMERLDKNCRVLAKLAVGDSVLVQNQVGNHPSRWDITGVVVEVKDHDQYIVKVDGSGRMTIRNRKFLKKIIPYSMTKHFKTSDSPADPTDPPMYQPPVAVEAVPLHQPPEPQEPRPERQEAPNPVPADMPPIVQAPVPVVEQAEAPRRSSRVSKEPDRLEISWGTKSYAQVVSDKDPGSLCIKDSIHLLDPDGGRGRH